MPLPRAVMRRKACRTPWFVGLSVGVATLLMLALTRNSMCTPNNEHRLCSLNSPMRILQTLLVPLDLSGCVKKRKLRSMAPCHYCFHGSSARMRSLRSQSKSGWRVPPPYGARFHPSRWSISHKLGFRVSSLASFAVVLKDLYDLIVLGRPAVTVSRVRSQRGATYDTTRYDSYAADTHKTFSSFYSFCFALAKPEYVRYFLLLNASAHVTIQGVQGTLTWKQHVLSGRFC
jgi:hypothetical protein